MGKRLTNRYVKALLIWVALDLLVLISEKVILTISNSLEWSNDMVSLVKDIRAVFYYLVMSLVGYLMIRGWSDRRIIDRLFAVFGFIISISGVVALFRKFGEIIISIMH